MKTTKILLLSGFLVSLAIFASCADDIMDSDGTDGDKGVAVSFNINDVQNDAPASPRAESIDGMLFTRAAFADGLALQALVPEDLISQKLAAEGGESNICLIETTTAGVNPTKKEDAHTRANISTAITGKFSSIGYRGTSLSGISATPWFHNKETNASGTLVEDIRWAWAQPYSRFYGISPQVTADYSKLQVSPDNYAGTPYVDFEVEQDVKRQKDLMTACSGVVHYATRFVAPTTNLAFRHALTAVRFKVGQNLSWNKYINKVEIINAMSKGRYTLATDETGMDAGWSGQSAPATFTLGGDGTVNVSTSQDVNQIIMGNAGDNYTFYMIPQSLSGVSVKIYFSDGSAPISVNLSGTWKPGTTKTYALSQNTSTWQYQLTVTNPTVADYTSTTAASYTVQSYREDPVTHVQQAVKWNVVGYDNNNDGIFSMTEKPTWLASLSMEEGNGGTSAESGFATITSDVVDLLSIRNKMLKEVTPKGSAGSPYNLSNSTGSTAVQNTANSYVISAPGHYRIPLVYGNAITGGAANSHAYQTTVSGKWVLQNFKDHVGNNITDPWITQTNGGANAPDNAKVVWADESGLVTNLSVSGSGTNAFVNFEVPASAIKNGNAVIAVTKGSTVVWSWHLWFAPQDVLQTVACMNFQNQVYNFTNETLGYKYTAWNHSTYSAPRSVRVKVEQAVANGSVKQFGVFTITQNNGSVRQGYGTLYQFGRKDAFPGMETTPEGSFNENGGNHMSIQNGIQHPDVFYTWGESWYNDPPAGYAYCNLWSMENTTTGFNDNSVTKTIYDPCPAGFKMPASKAFTGFTVNGQNTSPMNVSGIWDYGWNLNNKISSPDATIYFPASGSRGNAGGLLGNVGIIGCYWSAIPYTMTHACALVFTQRYMRPKYNFSRSFGFSVRPVSE